MSYVYSLRQKGDIADQIIKKPQKTKKKHTNTDFTEKILIFP